MIEKERILQGNLVGDEGEGAASELLRVTHSGFLHPRWLLQWRGDICSFQESCSNGTLFLPGPIISFSLCFSWSLFLGQSYFSQSFNATLSPLIGLQFARLVLYC